MCYVSRDNVLAPTIMYHELAHMLRYDSGRQSVRVVLLLVSEELVLHGLR